MVDDQILKAVGALIAAVNQQLSLLDAEIAAMQRRLAELEVIIVAPAPLSIAEVFFVEAMLTATLRAAEAEAAELPLVAVETQLKLVAMRLMNPKRTSKKTKKTMHARI